MPATCLAIVVPSPAPVHACLCVSAPDQDASASTWILLVVTQQGERAQRCVWHIPMMQATHVSDA
eukprot:6109118-Amphidinium_carterae.1